MNPALLSSDHSISLLQDDGLRISLLIYIPLESVINKKNMVTKRITKNLPGLEVIKLEYNLKLKIKRNELLLADTCPQAVNHCAFF